MNPRKLCVITNPWRRGHYLRQVFDALAQCPEARRVDILAFTDGEGDPSVGKTIEEARSRGDFASVRVFPSARRIGCNKNLLRAIEGAFAEGYEHAILLEEDDVPSPDFLQFAEWWLDHHKEFPDNVASAAAWSRLPAFPNYRSGRTIWTFPFRETGWGEVITKDRWPLIRPGFDVPDHIGNDTGTKIHCRQVCQARPVLSRIANIGRTGGGFTPSEARHDHFTIHQVAGLDEAKSDEPWRAADKIENAAILCAYAENFARMEASWKRAHAPARDWYTIPGWFDDHEADAYRWLAERIPMWGTMVEVGSYCGRSISAIAKPLLDRKALAWCVDLFGPGPKFGKPGAPDLVPAEDMLVEFVRHTIGAVPAIPVKGKSMDIARRFFVENRIFDLIFIDGSHEYEDAKTDIAAWRRVLKPGGWMAGHDYGGGYPGVKRAVDEAFGDAVGKPKVGSVWTWKKH